MTIWIEEVNDEWFGKCWEISTETWDGAVYFGDTMEEAIARFEDDKGVKAKKVIEVKFLKGEK